LQVLCHLIHLIHLARIQKKGGEKKDPEAHMLTAMLIALELNKDNKTLYGSYLIGHN
jgi:hypothetical protein